MNKEGFFIICDSYLRKRNGSKISNGIIGNAESREKCNYFGVYAIFEKDKLLYIGSAYSKDHKINDRLKQYITKGDSGNNLWEKVIKDGKASNEAEAIDFIKKLNFIAFEHNDLEQDLIKNTKCKWNIKGNKNNG